MDLKVVSQLLAGLLSEPGRSPGAARVARLRESPAGAAPRPASRRLMSAPFVGRGGGSVSVDLCEGISLEIVCYSVALEATLSDSAYTICWTGVVSPVVCTSGAKVCW
jgi:hypothetical protein